MYLTWGRLASHRSRQKYLDGQESKCTAIAHFCCDDLCEWSWSSYFTTHHDYISCAQPVLDFLLWHHLGPNYEERAHDLLQVKSQFPKLSFHSTSNPLHASYDRCTSNISPTLSMGWTSPPWLNSTFGGQRYRLQGEYFVSSIICLDIGWNLGDCCSLGSRSPNSFNSHRKASRRPKPRGSQPWP